MKPFYVVQSLIDYTFLYLGDSGDIDHTPFLSLAGRFDDYDEAVEAALDEIGNQFSVIPVLR